MLNKLANDLVKNYNDHSINNIISKIIEITNKATVRENQSITRENTCLYV